VIDRDTASRLGITPQNVDDTLYDAFGQRQVSTIFTQLNQYHVVLEVGPTSSAGPATRSTTSTSRSASGTQVPLNTVHASGSTHRTRPWPSTTRASSRGDGLVQPGAGRLARRRGDAVNQAKKDLRCRPASTPASRARRSVPESLANEPILILAALVTVYIVLGVLYESYIHPITILSTLPSAGVGALLALMLCSQDLRVIALIGIILLIGIVKKNAIMMIDFALEAERDEGQDARRGHLPGLPAALPAHHDDHHGRAAGRLPLALGTAWLGTAPPLGITIVGGLIVQPGADALHHAGDLSLVRVEVNPQRLSAMGLTLEDVRAALSTANANIPKGQLSDGHYSWTLGASDQLLSADKYKPLIVAYRNGAAVRLSDLADVLDSVEDVRTGGVANGKPAVLIIISRQPGANIIDTADRVIATIPQLAAEIPAGMKLAVVMDRTTTIRASVHEVQFTMTISIVLVVLVVFAFLRDWRTTLIPAVAVPVSLIGTFGVMYLAGYSVDNLSLMALTVATGFVVDDAIVVIENITRHLEAGMTAMQASLLGAREIGFTVVSMSTSLVAVFLPILLMGGLVGRLFREFAVVLSVAIGISLLVSLTTTPMMCARLLRDQRRERHGLIYRFSEWIFDSMLGLYRATLSVVLRHPLVMILLTFATIALNVYLYVVIPKGLFPQQDTGRLSGNILADQDTSFQAMNRMVTQFATAVAQDPDVAGVLAFTGGGRGGGTVNTAHMFVTLKDVGVRKLTADQVMARLRGRLSRIPGATLYLQPVQDLRVGGRQSNAQYQYTLQGDNLADLLAWAPKLQTKLATLPNLTDVSSDQQNRGLESMVKIDRPTASRLGITPQAIDDTLYDAFGQRQVSTMYTPLNQYHVVMEAAPQYLQRATSLEDIYVHSAGGAVTPLSSTTSFSTDTTFLAVNHQGLFPAVTLSFNLLPGVALSDAATEIEKAKQEIGLPASIHAVFRGRPRSFRPRWPMNRC
jgi:multidrug efflux pump subunit AcrB